MNTEPVFRAVALRDAPIFRQDRVEDVLFYTPGYAAIADVRHVDAFQSHLAALASDTVGSERFTSSDHSEINEPVYIHAARLYHEAVSVRERWAAAQMRPFTPLCLTLYLHTACNLHCTYCFAGSQPLRVDTPRLNLKTIELAAEAVAEACAAQGRPFTVVFHGGGEPTLDQELADDALTIVERMAARCRLAIFRYIATNGIMSTQKAAWMAARVDLIGLSCDGPAEIQSRQRGENTNRYVERTARIVNQAGKPLHVRVTLTPDGLARQAEIAAYLCRQLHPQEIEVEPVYQGGRAGKEDCFRPEQAEDFVNEFLRARETARRFGVTWQTSGSRPGEMHGPYCNVFRNVVNLIPGGAAIACFKNVDAGQCGAIGQVNDATHTLVLDHDRIALLRHELSAAEPECAACFNQYHCARGCPDQCPIEQGGYSVAAGFRCRMQKLLAQALIQEAANSLHNDGNGIVTSGALNI